MTIVYVALSYAATSFISTRLLLRALQEPDDGQRASLSVGSTGASLRRIDGVRFYLDAVAILVFVVPPIIVGASVRVAARMLSASPPSAR